MTMTGIPILDDEAVAEILARAAKYKRLAERAATPADEEVIRWLANKTSALCRTVKELRKQLDLYAKAFELDSALKLPEVGNLNALQIVRRLTQAKQWQRDVEEREAAVCPEDVGFDEYIRSLQSQLEQLRAENERVREDNESLREICEQKDAI